MYKLGLFNEGGFYLMVGCPVCLVVRFNAYNTYEMLVGGVVRRVCYSCYHRAFLKTNLSRMLRRRKFSDF